MHKKTETIEAKGIKALSKMSEEEKINYIQFLERQVHSYEVATRQFFLHIPDSKGHV